MADHHRKYSKHRTDSKRDKSAKRSKDSKHHLNESRTPPYSSKNNSIDELIKQRETLKEELKKFSKHSKSSSKSKHDDHGKKRSSSDNLHKDKNSKRSKSEKNSSSTVYVESSPVHNVDYTQLDSEDEESIIEQRRQQRKRLLEQLTHSKVIAEQENKTNQEKCITKQDMQETTNSNENKTQIKSETTDMFAEEDFIAKQLTDKVTQDNSKNSIQLTDNWDDEEGYYNIKIGDIINNNRYTIKSLVGQGVFANVIRAQDTKTNTEVAIKIMRNNDLMYKTGLKEIATLKEMNTADPTNKYHCVKLDCHFMHKKHLCLVLESLHMDLRVVLKKYGRHGLNIKALNSYSVQLLLALRLLKKVGYIHADIKPDNILVNDRKNVLKLCDFGSAFKVEENEPTPYLVSRFYRAPEIILGITYNHGVDIWSTACTMYEMATGKILFTGNSNNKMLKCFMDLKGRIPTRLLKKGKFKDQHFNYNNNFLYHRKDEFSGREKCEEVSNITIGRDLLKEIKKARKEMTPGEEKKIGQLKDLLDKMLMLDPAQRISVNECLKHPFIREELHY
ncbi:serine/threonine-protein kinase PRP4 homolog [Pieris napi]|uniref:serine/threonine-protein kinase PRP4 homolog n=1 Tax=Pieris napi TaxID=78633 RepID=UPI001FB9A1A7|nr:serine/threonine-protein kinase PRP4 homolog [Pieris napi]XP_047514317.1 serine/threonine-protein kinase PRP4 homolog [Pieris napi]XP_047514327.1 serine/threonine-protein kinase PRP4 homolog [Pieris napi]XP_047514335.1 serine/threonine-protein kinase PRP4 homolog [Pieris napi]XP_047514344.1 serine/threonine-protein kinase PRP4 homolog [Pieris napi]XP_047514352.1 serine/threonine-protein kinase PRP4 homolog [Pieris napi]XP_047514361.1 serine/threonine-protein kinase PRP4 homolog [Pieris nap